MDPAKSAKGVEIMLELFGEIRIAQLKHKDLINQARKKAPLLLYNNKIMGG